MNQAGTVADYERQMAQMESGLRFQDASQAQQNRLAGATGMQSGYAQQAAAATALLQALQGTQTNQKGRQDVDSFYHKITGGVG
jgi:uncharacterized protein YhaN